MRELMNKPRQPRPKLTRISLRLGQITHNSRRSVESVSIWTRPPMKLDVAAIRGEVVEHVVHRLGIRPNPTGNLDRRLK